MAETEPRVAPPSERTGPTIVRATALAAAASAAANLAVYVVARVAGADLIVPESPGSDAVERLGPGPVVLVTTVFALSFVSFFMNDFSAGTATALVLMHVVVAGFALLFLRPVTQRAAG